jgi:hypothetical protein
MKSCLFGCAGSFLGILILFGGCAILFSSSYNEVTKEASGKSEISDKSWIPAGYYPFNNNIAYKWSNSGTYSCSYGERCIQMEIFSKNGCDSLYVELTKLDAAGNNVGYTNETTSTVKARQKAILKFEIFGNFKSTQVAKINCI